MEREGAAGGAVVTTQIFVAASDINIGQKLDANNVKLEEWPKDRVPDGALTELEQLTDRFPRTRLYAGEPVLKAKLMDSNDGSKSVTIPKGYRVVSVKVSMESSVSGLVQPGDRVDLLVFLRKNGEVPVTGTKTILRDVNVFAVDAATERNVDSNGVAYSLRTVSLLVKPDQAETITLATGLGELFMTLRRPDDDLEADSQGMTVQMLFGNEQPSGMASFDSPAAGAEPPGFVQWLAQSAAQAATPPAAAAQTVAAAVPEKPPVWTMRILTQDGYREFRWNDVNDLPDEVLKDASAANDAPVSRQAVVPAPSDTPGGMQTEDERPETETPISRNAT